MLRAASSDRPGGRSRRPRRRLRPGHAAAGPSGRVSRADQRRLPGTASAVGVVWVVRTRARTSGDRCSPVIASTPTETADPGEHTRGPVSHQGVVVDDASPAAGRGHVVRPAPRHSGAADGRRQSSPGRSPPAKSALAPSVRAAGTVAAARTAVAREAVGTLAIDSASSACSGGISGETTSRTSRPLPVALPARVTVCASMSSNQPSLSSRSASSSPPNPTTRSSPACPAPSRCALPGCSPCPHVSDCWGAGASPQVGR